MIDLAIVILVVVYAALGYYTGLIRRIVGFAAVYLGLLAATTVGPTGGSVILQAEPGWTLPDGLIAGYFLVLVLVVVVIEVFAAFSHARLQLAAIAFDRASGLLVGALTAILGVTVVLFLLLGGSQPAQGSPDGAQIQIGDGIRHSVLGPLLLRGIGRPAVILFEPVTPLQPSVFFSGQEARAQH